MVHAALGSIFPGIGGSSSVHKFMGQCSLVHIPMFLLGCFGDLFRDSEAFTTEAFLALKGQEEEEDGWLPLWEPLI